MFVGCSDERGSFINCREVLDELGLSHATEQDCANVRYICECVSRRAAHLVSSGIATLINKMGEKNVTVGIDGSVYRYHPHFHNLMVEKISQFINPGIVVSRSLLNQDCDYVLKNFSYLHLRRTSNFSACTDF